MRSEHRTFGSLGLARSNPVYGSKSVVDQLALNYRKQKSFHTGVTRGPCVVGKR